VTVSGYRRLSPVFAVATASLRVPNLNGRRSGGGDITVGCGAMPLTKFAE
jgi:hypothetical protein